MFKVTAPSLMFQSERVVAFSRMERPEVYLVMYFESIWRRLPMRMTLQFLPIRESSLKIVGLGKFWASSIMMTELSIVRPRRP